MKQRDNLDLLTVSPLKGAFRILAPLSLFIFEEAVILSYLGFIIDASKFPWKTIRCITVDSSISLAGFLPCIVYHG